MTETREQPRWHEAEYVDVTGYVAWFCCCADGRHSEHDKLGEDRLNALESELAALREQAKIGSAVVAAYRHNPVVVAEVCDEALDQSGALLDWVHAAAKEYPHD